jgi:hypothetical protein
VGKFVIQDSKQEQKYDENRGREEHGKYLRIRRKVLTKRKILEMQNRRKIKREE